MPLPALDFEAEEARIGAGLKTAKIRTVTGVGTLGKGCDLNLVSTLPALHFTH